MSGAPIGDRRRFERLPGGGYVYELVDEPLRIEARHLRRDHSQLHAEVDVICDWAGVKTHNRSLSCADLNLSSQSARRTLATHCAQRAGTKPTEFDWLGALDAACLEVIRAERQGEAPIILDDAPDVLARDLDVFGLTVPADAASMLIAHGDSLKSLLVLLVLGTLAQRGQPVLLLDWEWSADRHRARKRRLLGAERLERLHYLRCRAPLVLECDRVRRYCDEQQIAFLGVDSVGLAADGPLKDDDVAIRFHRALASLPPALCAAHVPKSAVSTDVKVDPIGPFGSVFFANLSRASWLVKKQPGPSDDVVTVGLFPQKQNDNARQRPVGLEFAFSADRIGVRPVDLAGVAGLGERLPLAVRMMHVLRRGPLSFAEIANELDAKLDSVIKAAKRCPAFTKVDGTDGKPRIALVERRIA